MNHPRAPFGRSPHDAAQRAADIIDVLVPRPAGQDETVGPADPGARRAGLMAVLRAYGEPEPLEISETGLAAMRQAAVDLREVFAAGDVATAAARINELLAAHAHPPRLTCHSGGYGWHLHVDSDDDAPWGQWFLTSSCLALGVLLAERQAPPAGLCASPSCGKPFVNVGRGRARRYCSAGCGTRDRVAAHRAARGVKS